ncbi:dihydrolipoamide acetyltransferase family protein [Streptomyces sp. H27-D2]|uniref:dihydrolipoamide acetyltransferase family protein n=1 Tax=Streptomyces sp. H27-D2 TaxID=3046304 RepID=UPI002DBD9450|nr:dihydrolipoamide acetyltransferase family protein [Streptomyces sp. H27-D2]MEC4017373.1 dihydrolipoamide acetyltransferase family protein [Streptomyces sp. H27-D2]
MPVVKEFTLPDLGEGLTEAEIVRWLVKVGDVVAIDQVVVEVETAKAMVEVPCPYGGVVTACFGAEGAELPVGAPLLTVAVGAAAAGAAGRAGGGGEAAVGEGAAGDASAAAAGSGGSEGSAGKGSGDEGSGNVLVGYGTAAPAARRRRIRPGGTSRTGGAAADPAAGAGSGGSADSAGRTGSGLGTGSGSGSRSGRAPEARGTGSSADGHGQDHGHVEGDEPIAVISPLVRRLAREGNVDLRTLRGSGPEGLILRVDVEDAVHAATAAPAAPVSAGAAATTGTPERAPDTAARTAAAGTPHETRIPLRGLRGLVAEKLSRSRREIPDATCWVDADATELFAARAAMNAAQDAPKVSLLALFARICAAGLARYPELNSTVDMEAREIVRLPAVHLGFAAQTDRGLVVPVVRDAHTRNAADLSAEIGRLSEAARAGRLTTAELTGGTFTLNNYGVFGVDGSTPILNHPEAAMLGVGRITPKPWVHQGELAVRQVVQLSFTFDHRVCDGGTAGGFLRYVADCVEQPAILLRTL